VQKPVPVWLGVGGTPQPLVRAGTVRLPLLVAIIGGQPAQFRGLIERYRDAGARAGHTPGKLAVGVHSSGFLADPTAAAATMVSAHGLLGGLTRQTVLLDNGALAHRQVLGAIERLDTQVAPLVRRGFGPRGVVWPGARRMRCGETGAATRVRARHRAAENSFHGRAGPGSVNRC
jgi:alkanesulfonate monooxygenase SsuD/methylene tetrahydromethanopterin reductase-like flavin-dependent oxidoreductase (luciferase family)